MEFISLVYLQLVDSSEPGADYESVKLVGLRAVDLIGCGHFA
jgi:hypothetical protein